MDLTPYIPPLDQLETLLNEAPSLVEFDFQNWGFYLQNQQLMLYYGSYGMKDSAFLVRFNQFNPYVLYSGYLTSDGAHCDQISLVVPDQESRLRSSISFDRNGVSHSLPDKRLAVRAEWFDNGSQVMYKAWNRYSLPLWINSVKRCSSDHSKEPRVLN